MIIVITIIIILVAGHWVPLYVDIPIKSVQDHDNVYEFKKNKINGQCQSIWQHFSLCCLHS